MLQPFLPHLVFLLLLHLFYDFFIYILPNLVKDLSLLFLTDSIFLDLSTVSDYILYYIRSFLLILISVLSYSFYYQTFLTDYNRFYYMNFLLNSYQHILIDYSFFSQPFLPIILYELFDLSTHFILLLSSHKLSYRLFYIYFLIDSFILTFYFIHLRTFYFILLTTF